MSTVNLANITDVVFNTTSVNELIVDGTLTWIKYNNQSYSIGQEFWISGVVHTITGFDHSSGVPLSFQFNDASGTSNYITITNPTFSSSDPSVNNTPYSIDQVVYINGVTEKTITDISGTTITFSDNSTLDNDNLGSDTIEENPTNGTNFSVNQVVYINGLIEKTITGIVGTTITFSDGSTLDNSNLSSGSSIDIY